MYVRVKKKLCVKIYVCEKNYKKKLFKKNQKKFFAARGGGPIGIFLYLGPEVAVMVLLG